MIRRALFDRSPRRDAEDDFTWRGDGVSRLENLSDIVFAFAVSFLVASADVPATFGELTESLVELLFVGFGFAIILLVWHSHYVFFRRYGLQDTRTVWLNAVLLFLILMFVYPLRFVAMFTSDLALGRMRGPAISDVLALEQIPALQILYSGGFAAVFAVFTLLYRHAAGLADSLNLSEIERVLTAERVALGVMYVGIALSAIALSFVIPPRWSMFSFWVYVLIGVFTPLVRRPYQRAYRELTSETK